MSFVVTGCEKHQMYGRIIIQYGNNSRIFQAHTKETYKQGLMLVSKLETFLWFLAMPSNS
jgi:hypothetical protein